jgi:hypothetical protein
MKFLPLDLCDRFRRGLRASPELFLMRRITLYPAAVSRISR